LFPKTYCLLFVPGKDRKCYFNRQEDLHTQKIDGFESTMCPVETVRGINGSYHNYSYRNVPPAILIVLPWF
ncbi:MAG TPA: hypothetical protein PK496_09480, partial [Bacteroidales bacterium]|nr:hypothetical protein [Bacteroidales bacterium]